MFNLLAKLSLQILQLVQQHDLVFFAVNILLSDLVKITNEILNDAHAFIQFGFTSIVVLNFVLF